MEGRARMVVVLFAFVAVTCLAGVRWGDGFNDWAGNAETSFGSRRLCGGGNGTRLLRNDADHNRHLCDEVGGDPRMARPGQVYPLKSASTTASSSESYSEDENNE